MSYQADGVQIVPSPKAAAARDEGTQNRRPTPGEANPTAPTGRNVLVDPPRPVEDIRQAILPVTTQGETARSRLFGVIVDQTEDVVRVARLSKVEVGGRRVDVEKTGDRDLTVEAGDCQDRRQPFIIGSVEPQFVVGSRWISRDISATHLGDRDRWERPDSPIILPNVGNPSEKIEVRRSSSRHTLRNHDQVPKDARIIVTHQERRRLRLGQAGPKIGHAARSSVDEIEMEADRGTLVEVGDADLSVALGWVDWVARKAIEEEDASRLAIAVIVAVGLGVRQNLGRGQTQEKSQSKDNLASLL